MATKTVDRLGRSNRRWAILVGIGLALSPIHNRWITDVTLSEHTVVEFFLPSFGTALWLLGSLLCLTWSRQKIDWGDKKVYVPLGIIALAIGISGIANGASVQDKVAPLFMGISLFAVYLVTRRTGKIVFLPLAIGSGIASLGVIVHAVLYPGQMTGGFVFEQNYDIVVGYVLLGAVLLVHKRQWMLSGWILVAILLTGSPEGIFVTGVLGIAVLLRRDWGKRLLALLLPVVLVLVLCFSLGYGQALYSYVAKVAQNELTTPYPERSGDEVHQRALEYRLVVVRDSMQNIKPFGEGYNITDFGKIPNVHNVPLVIVQQLGWSGILAGLAWLWVSLYCWRRTKWKYAWVLVLALSVWDHYIWTQLGPLWWAIVGLSTTPSNITIDLIFRKSGVDK